MQRQQAQAAQQAVQTAPARPSVLATGARQSPSSAGEPGMKSSSSQAQSRLTCPIRLSHPQIHDMSGPRLPPSTPALRKGGRGGRHKCPRPLHLSRGAAVRLFPFASFPAVGGLARPEFTSKAASSQGQGGTGSGSRCRTARHLPTPQEGRSAQHNSVGKQGGTPVVDAAGGGQRGADLRHGQRHAQGHRHDKHPTPHHRHGAAVLEACGGPAHTCCR